jgi:hypothetical protein
MSGSCPKVQQNLYQENLSNTSTSNNQIPSGWMRPAEVGRIFFVKYLVD